MSPPRCPRPVPPSRTALARVRRSVALERSIRLDPGTTGCSPVIGRPDRCPRPLLRSLLSRVELSQLGVELFVVIADYQTITDRDSPASLSCRCPRTGGRLHGVGIDPGRATIFAHSK